MARHDRDARLALLERQLRALGPEVAVPDARRISVAVRRHLESGTVPTGSVEVPTSPTSPTSPTRRRVLIGVAVVLVLAAGITLAISSSRNAVADWLGLRGVEIEHRAEPPSGLAADLRLGRRVSLGEARRAVGFEPVVAPRAQYGAPDAIYVADNPEGGRVTFVYEPRRGLPAAAGSGVGLLVTEFEAEVDEPVLRKTAGTGTTVEVLDLNGQRAYWLEGAPHVVVFTDRDGRQFEDEGRLAGNTLLFGNGSRTIRIESALGRAETLALAATLERA